ncbi:hypothetical protein CC1G_08309 [Coprinopsis cinerea okayama7|uniref:Uncharacterized protein n=1 Tax=Coprinopsis cinerea (strain Okayama-7 / 130 / ATCC MYA-4618 / FGSC 9003) TaxID=240176 RepID=A8PG78_COPC7|nr:hypothetical protein CC1G_08309 [Coprinopsis cinerea okayama7\|eukprot:XP_001841165.1 hypothetical protein CC1G_08309 [Coprinopsis cinerea okayama7\
MVIGGVAAQAGIFERCNIAHVGEGLCMDASSCTYGGGTAYGQGCKNSENGVACCYKRCPNPVTGQGRCVHRSSCATGKVFIADYCPGPSNFGCCLSD